MWVAESGPQIRVDVEHQHRTSVLIVDGVLDSTTYRGLRDAVIKAALDEPSAVIVDVDGLSVPAASAWSVFTSARWHVSTWPDIPILLVCGYTRVRRVIAASGVARYVPVHPSRESALDAVGNGSLHGRRRRARVRLPASAASVGRARETIADWLTVWGQSNLIAAAGTVATVFVENVLSHTDSAPVLIVEAYQDAVTVAVEDCSARLPVRREDAAGGIDSVSGLAIVEAVCRAWGATPTPSGKTVWGLVGRENQL